MYAVCAVVVDDGDVCGESNDDLVLLHVDNVHCWFSTASNVQFRSQTSSLQVDQR